MEGESNLGLQELDAPSLRSSHTPAEEVYGRIFANQRTRSHVSYQSIVLYARCSRVCVGHLYCSSTRDRQILGEDKSVKSQRQNGQEGHQVKNKAFTGPVAENERQDD